MKASLVARTLVVVAAVLVVLHFCGQLVYFAAEGGEGEAFTQLFDFNDEHNVPTTFSVLLLFVAAQLFAIVWIQRRREAAPHASRWLVLAAGFLFMSFDEGARLHEKLTEPFRELLDGEVNAIFYYGWIVPGLLVVIVAALFFRRFLADLPAAVRRRFLLAGALYLGGALGMELLGGWYEATYGWENWTYVLIATAEETLELAGSILLIWTLLRLLADRDREVRLTFDA